MFHIHTLISFSFIVLQTVFLIQGFALNLYFNNMKILISNLWPFFCGANRQKLEWSLNP
jgi:hypothetical protein